MVEWRDSLEYRWSTWSTSSSCVLERSREVTMVARVHVASKYYIQTMLSLGRCLSTTNISYAIIRCTVAPTVSPAWSQGMPGTYIIYKGIPLLRCTPLVLISWVRMGYPCLRSTRNYLLVHPLSNYVRPPIQLQHTDEHTDSS